MANRVHPAPTDADNSSGSPAAACIDWRIGDADSMSARAAPEPTTDAGYTTAGASLKPKLSVNFLQLRGSPYRNTKGLPAFWRRHRVPRLRCESQSETFERGSPVKEITRVGVDLAKNVIQVHGVDAQGRPVVRRALPRDKFLAWCAHLPTGCVVAMEASSSAHHWARHLVGLGLQARIIAGHRVAPYRLQGKSGKNDANDAAAICEAASRPGMHFVPIKTVAQQSQLCVHRLREGIKEERNACINRIRGWLAEFGLVVPQSPRALRAVLSDMIEDASNEMGTLARLSLQRCVQQWRELDAHLDWCDERIAS